MRNLKFSVFFLIVVFFTAANSQNKTADSLVVVLNRSKSDIDKAELLNAISDSYKTTDPKWMLKYAQMALQLSKKIDHKFEEGNAYLNIGNANIILGNYPIALQNFSQAQAIFENTSESSSVKKNDIKNGLARAYGSIGIIFSEQSSYSKALQYHLKAVKIYEQINNREKCARIYNNIGIVYKSQGEDFKALEYFTKCLKIQEQIGDKSVGITTTNIGNIYLKQQNYPKALEFYNKAKQLFEKYPDYRGLGELYNNIGLYFKHTNDQNMALQNYTDALATFQKIDDKFGASDTYAFIGDIYSDQKKYDFALENINKSLELGKSLGIQERIQESEKKLSEIYTKLNNTTEAFRHFQLYSIAKDSISNYENIRNSVRAEMDFEFDKKEMLQKKEQEKKELVYAEKSKRHGQQLLFAVLIALLISGIVFLIYSRIHLKKTLTLQKELAEYEQKALHLQMNPHFVFNCLGSISSFILQNGTDQAIKYLSKFSKLMRLTLEYSKESLIPIDREIESLENYLELEQLRFNHKFDFTIAKSNDIEDDVALPPLLLQPFVENAIIHGLIPRKETGKIDIDFSLGNRSLVCTITDTGIGFDTSQELKKNLLKVHKSMALDITRKRLEMMEAFTSKTSHVDIDEMKDSEGKTTGTKVVLVLPIQYITKA